MFPTKICYAAGGADRELHHTNDAGHDQCDHRRAEATERKSEPWCFENATCGGEGLTQMIPPQLCQRAYVNGRELLWVFLVILAGFGHYEKNQDSANRSTARINTEILSTRQRLSLNYGQ